MQLSTQQIQQWAEQLGFAEITLSKPELARDEAYLMQWLAKGFHGDMEYMQRHGTKRSRPQLLIPETITVLSVRMNYWPATARPAAELLDHPSIAYLSRYALGRDYHKVMRNRLQKLVDQMQGSVGPFAYRVFSDSAPVLEKAIAQQGGMGWIGKHTNLITTKAGSYFFLGEVYLGIDLEVHHGVKNHCGTCQTCIDVCPTQAIVAPYQLDARRCISYLTIEHKGAIPEALRKPMGNRIYGCDDCQLFCPWNRFAQLSTENDYQPRHGLDAPDLLALFSWDEPTFYRTTEGMAIRRIGYERWSRNLAVGIGNSKLGEQAIVTLQKYRARHTDMVREHIDWAMRQLRSAQLD